MSEWQPITTARELAALDPVEIMEGYMDGYAGEPRPGANRSPSYRHGWFNGNQDRIGGSTPEQIALIRDCRRMWGNDITRWGDPLPTPPA